MIELDEAVSLSTKQARGLFDFHINAAPEQGTLKIRTEEDVLVSMGALYPCLREAGLSKPKMI